MKKITIYDICREARVSMSTVSNVLNNKPKVGSTTRKRVLRVMERLKYTPKAAARNLCRNKTDTIGIIYPRFNEGKFMQLTHGIEKVLQPNGYFLLMVGSTDALGISKPFAAISKIVHEQRVDGIILLNENLTLKETEELRKFPVPIVAIDRMLRNPAMDAVVYDNFNGGYEAVRHLINHGYERIATLTGPLAWEGASERLRAYQTAMKDYSLPVDPEMVVEGTWGAEPSTSRFIAAFRDRQWPEAIFAANDDVAFGLLDYTRHHRDPAVRATAIVGFDDERQATFAGLTSLSGPLEDWGSRLAKLLVDLMGKKRQAGEPPRIEVQPVHLVIRSSCGCAYSPMSGPAFS